MHILIVLSQGKIENVMCCADGNDRAHLLTLGKDYQVLDLDELENIDWLQPKLYSSDKKEDSSGS